MIVIYLVLKTRWSVTYESSRVNKPKAVILNGEGGQGRESPEGLFKESNRDSRIHVTGKTKRVLPGLEGEITWLVNFLIHTVVL